MTGPSASLFSSSQPLLLIPFPLFNLNCPQLSLAFILCLGRVRCSQLPAIGSWWRDLCLPLSLNLLIANPAHPAACWMPHGHPFVASNGITQKETYCLLCSGLLVFLYSLFPRFDYSLLANNISWHCNPSFPSIPSMARRCGSSTFCLGPFSCFLQVYLANLGFHHLSPELLLCSPCLSPCLHLAPSDQPSIPGRILPKPR